MSRPGPAVAVTRIAGSVIFALSLASCEPEPDSLSYDKVAEYDA